MGLMRFIHHVFLILSLSQSMFSIVSLKSVQTSDQYVCVCVYNQEL